MMKPFRSLLKHPDPLMFGATNQVTCPVCKDEYVHVGAPTFKRTDNYDAWEGRGSCVTVPMTCESGHEWEVKFGFHKGYTFVFVDAIKEQEYEN